MKIGQISFWGHFQYNVNKINIILKLIKCLPYVTDQRLAIATALYYSIWSNIFYSTIFWRLYLCGYTYVASTWSLRRHRNNPSKWHTILFEQGDKVGVRIRRFRRSGCPAFQKKAVFYGMTLQKPSITWPYLPCPRITHGTDLYVLCEF